MGFKVLFRPLRSASNLGSLLRRDGWDLLLAEHSMVARHPKVVDEQSARSRLGHIGLLTASWLHIEFSAFKGHGAAEEPGA